MLQPDDADRRTDTYATLPMRAAIYNAMLGFSVGTPLAEVPYNCPTGNCTWPPFRTLAICNSACANITNLTAVVARDGYSVTWGLPPAFNNLTLKGYFNSTTHPYRFMNSTSVMHGNPDHNPPYLPVLDMAILKSAPLNQTVAHALSCQLDYCVRVVQSSVRSGILQENFTRVESSWSPFNILTENETLSAVDQTNHALGPRSFVVDDFA